MKKKNDELSFKDLLNIFMPKLWIILLVAVLMGALLGFYSAFVQDETYTSRSKIMVTKDTGGTLTSTDRYLASDMVELYEVIIKSDAFLEIVIEGIKENPTYSKYAEGLTTGSLSSVISISQHGETEVFEVYVKTSDPQKSYAIADVLSSKISTELGQMLTYNDVSTAIIDHARLNLTPNSKNIFRNTVIGVIGGAVLSMIVIFAVSMFDVVIRNRKKLDDNFDIPVLGVIPRFEIEEEGEK